MTQINYMLVRRKELKNVTDAKVLSSDRIALQHRPLAWTCAFNYTQSDNKFCSSQSSGGKCMNARAGSKL